MNSGQSPTFDDRELIGRFIAGDCQAIDDLYVRYAPQVLSFLAARVGNAADAEDLLHDSWLKVQENAGSFDGQNFRGCFRLPAAHCSTFPNHRDSDRRASTLNRNWKSARRTIRRHGCRGKKN
jgi:hypothetical protein